MKKRLLFMAIILLLTCGGNSNAQQPPYSKQAPIWVDYDMTSIPEPDEVFIGLAADFAHGNIYRPVKETFNVSEHFQKIFGKPKEAFNINSLDQVPNSSWFTNRIGVRALSIDEIKRGPNQSDGPQGKLTIIKGKSRGATPGFTVRDERGDLYLLKFDPVNYPEMASAAEVIATKLFYAAGYNVPENYVYRFRSETLQVDAKAELDEGGKKRAMTQNDIDQLLRKAARQSDGQYRCVASKLLSGKAKGGFRFFGVRDDDANDIIPHEHRRDVRGLRLFAAWVNHNDLRAENTLDLYVSEQGRQFIRHYLIDFGSTFGSETSGPNHPRAGHEYNVDYKQAGKMMVTLGIHQPKYLHDHRELRYPSIGFYSAENFSPDKWKPVIPQPALENMTDRDAFWAAKIIASFSDEQIRAIVATGELSDPDAADYLTEQIIKRRDIIAQHYLRERAAFDRFEIAQTGANSSLRFVDLRSQLIKDHSTNSNNISYEITPLGSNRVLAHGQVNANEIALTSELLAQLASVGKTDEQRGVARVILRRAGEDSATRVYIHQDNGQVKILGIEY